MEDSIIYKLRQFLNARNPITEECHVVYLLVQIRKLLDRIPERENEFLRFYCDWSVHTEKTGRIHVIAPIIQGIEDCIMKGHHFASGQFSPANNKPIEFIYKEELLKNMKDLFLQVNLPMDIFEQKNWIQFLQLLIQVLIDQPISPREGNIKSLCFRSAVGANLEVIFNDGKVYRFLNAF